MEIPDLPTTEVEHLYWEFSERASCLRDEFEKWVLRSLKLSALSVFSKLLIPILAETKDVPDLVNLLWIVYLMVAIAGLAAIKASLISIQEAKVHELLNGLEKLSEGVESTIRQKLLYNDKICGYFWRRPSFTLGFRILACTFPFFSIWVWSITFFISHYHDQQYFLIGVTSCVLVVIGFIQWLGHKFQIKFETASLSSKNMLNKKN